MLFRSGEYINIGLILYSKEAKYIRLDYHLNNEKFEMMCPDVEYDEIIDNLENAKKVAEGDSKQSPIASMDLPERFRWLTAVRSTIIQTSPTHAGKTDDPDKTFDRLFKELVI